MKRKKAKKGLLLSTERIHTLQTTDLAAVTGGGPKQVCDGPSNPNNQGCVTSKTPVGGGGY